MIASLALLAALHSTLAAPPTYQTRQVQGWTLHIRDDLLKESGPQVKHAIELLTSMLQEIERTVPKPAVTKLKRVQLYFSPKYPDAVPGAAYHPGAQWLIDNGRDPQMARGIEFTNILIFDDEIHRMPNFALHELAHSYHDQCLPQGFQNPEVKAAYDEAVKGTKYDNVEIRAANGTSHFGRSYAMTNQMEYFAETTEAFFSRNDIYPFVNSELKTQDPTIYAILGRVWHLP